MRASHGLRLIALAALLVGAQLALLVHGIEHAMHEPDAACVECLTLPSFAALPAAALAPARPPKPRGAVVIIVETVLEVAPLRAYLGRAPPPTAETQALLV